MTAEPASDRVRLRRGAIRAEYDRDGILAVLDAGLIAHVGVMTEEGPIVLPMAYGRDDDWLYVHGSVANAALRAAVDHGHLHHGDDRRRDGRRALPVPQLDELPGRRRAGHRPQGRPTRMSTCGR